MALIGQRRDATVFDLMSLGNQIACYHFDWFMVCPCDSAN